MRVTVVLVLILLVTASCKKEAVRPNQDVWLPQEMRDMFLFYPGSYWIMELPVSGYVDSIFVVETTVDTLPILHPGSKEVIGYKDRIRVKYMSSFYAWTYDFETDSRNFCSSQGIQEPCFFVRKQNYVEGKRSTNSYIYYYPEVVGQSWPVANNGREQEKLSITQIHPSFTIFDSTYQNAREVEISIDKTEQYQRTVRRFSPYIGMISWQIPYFGFNWVTVRYKVVQRP